ncbi:MAG: sensor histidine kinase [Anaerolineales bacterium]|nr:sensor histidine kinase [Anaerolineales bacterium]
MRSLRGRLIISHLLPLLVAIPLVSLAVLYILETQVLLNSLTDELAQQANLIAEFAAVRADIWENPEQARSFVASVSRHTQGYVTLLQSDGTLLESNDPVSKEQAAQLLALEDLKTAQSGQSTTHVSYSLSQQSEIASALAPVLDTNQQVVGLVRMTHRVNTIADRFAQLRWLALADIGLQLLVGGGIGLALALGLERPLHKATQAVYEVASGRQAPTLTEEGPVEVRQLQHAVNVLEQRLYQVEETRRNLLANLVHELGRPLGALQAGIGALRHGADQDPELRQELLLGMETEIEHLRPLLDDLAHLHDNVLGVRDLHCRPTPLSSWLPPLLLPWREAAMEKGLHWQADIPDNLPSLSVDPERLAQVIGNLLSNAIKYTPPGGAVTITANSSETEAAVGVSDTGPGIAAADQSRIFEPFYRVNQERRYPDGLGLGLTIAHDLVSAHNGRLTVNSTPGQGSRFTILLPKSS